MLNTNTMKIIQPVLLATMISGALFLLLSSAGINYQTDILKSSAWPVPAEDTDTHFRDFAPANISPPTEREDEIEPSLVSPGGELTPDNPVMINTRGRGYIPLANTETGTGIRLQNPFKSAACLNKNPLHNRIIQSTLQPIDLTIDPSVNPLPHSEASL